MTDICLGSETIFFETKNCSSLQQSQFPSSLIYPNLSYVNNSPDLFDICLLKWNNEGLMFELNSSFIIVSSQNDF